MKEIKTKFKEEQMFYGFSTISNEKEAKKDMLELIDRIRRVSKCDTVLPYVALIKDFYQDEGEFQLFVGKMEYHRDLEKLVVVEGNFATAEIEPAFGRFWRKAITSTKHYMETKWADKNGYTPGSVKYLLFSEKIKSEHPALDYYMQIEKK